MLINRLMHCGFAHNANRRSEWPRRASHGFSLAVSIPVTLLFQCSGSLQNENEATRLTRPIGSGFFTNEWTGQEINIDGHVEGIKYDL